MRGIFIPQPASGLALVIPIVLVPQMEQIRDHLVLLVSGQGSQFLFDSLNTHQPKLKGFGPKQVRVF